MDLLAKDVNILCEKDGKHTVGVEKMMLFSVLTFGVYKYVWLAEIVDRICDNAAEYDVEVRQDSETFFVWMILVPVLGYLVAMYRAIQDTNRLAEAYERSRQKRTEVHDNPNTKPPPPCMRGRLSGLTGSLAGRSFELIPGRSVELGRNPAEVSLIVRGEKSAGFTVRFNIMERILGLMLPTIPGTGYSSMGCVFLIMCRLMCPGKVLSHWQMVQISFS